MAEEGVQVLDAGAGSSTGKGTITDTPEFKEEVRKWREQKDKEVKAEIDRKKAELEASYHPPETETAGGEKDYFGKYEQYGIPREAAREIMRDTVGYVEQFVVLPLKTKAKNTELRGQRQEVRQTPQLAKLDDTYHNEVMEILKTVHPDNILADSYASALQLVIGRHYPELSKPAEPARPTDNRETEILTGPQPQGGGAPPTKRVQLSSFHQERAESMGLSAEDYVERMKNRARNLFNQGKTKEQVRRQLGRDIEGIEF